MATRRSWRHTVPADLSPSAYRSPRDPLSSGKFTKQLSSYGTELYFLLSGIPVRGGIATARDAVRTPRRPSGGAEAPLARA